MKKLFVLSLCLMSGIACAMDRDFLDDESLEKAFRDQLALDSGAPDAATFATASSQPLPAEKDAVLVDSQDSGKVEDEDIKGPLNLTNRHPMTDSMYSDQKKKNLIYETLSEQSQESSSILTLTHLMRRIKVESPKKGVHGVTKKRRTQKIRSNRIVRRGSYGPVTPPRKNVPPICPTAPVKNKQTSRENKQTFRFVRW